MQRESQEEYDNRVLQILYTYATVTPNQVARSTKRKQETAKRSLERLEEKGLIYSKRSGNRTYYILIGNGNAKRIKPDCKKPIKEVEMKTEVYGRPSWSINRASTRYEILQERGFVCHPSARGEDLPREFVRCHFNGEYQVGIEKIGTCKSREYDPNTNESIRWTKNGLSTNVSMNGYIQRPDIESEPFAFRTVSDANGQFKKLSIWVHPRYIFYVGHVESSEMEFEQQVKDILSVLTKFGWVFDYEIVRKGEPHFAINDPVFASHVGRYNQYPDDPLHFDHSHGVHEGEVYGNDPTTVEMMVRLPDILRSYNESIIEIQREITTLVDIQSKMLTLIPKPLKETDYGGMFQ